MRSQILFYGWWLLENLLTHYFAFDFLVQQTPERRYLPFWLAANGIMTAAALYWGFPGGFLWDALFLIFFSRVVLHLRAAEMSAPVTVILMLFTLKEGFSAVILSWASQSFPSATEGMMEQVFFSGVLVFLCFCALRMVRHRYSQMLRQAVSSFLYLLLFPCVFLAVLIRYLLRLDRPDFAPYLSAFGLRPRTAAFLMLIGAAAAAWLMIEVFCRMVSFMQKEKQMVLLEQQLSGHRAYLLEAKARNERYASFQHDIDNHLLVLSGLLQENRLEQAREYLQKLQEKSLPLIPPVSTGNTVLDILLREKFSYAKSLRIRLQYQVRIPEHSGVDSMDLCVLFSNLLDNAINACQKEPEAERFLSLNAGIRAGFLTVEAVNAAGSVKTAQAGTGLHNIQQIAEKYHGAVEIKLEQGRFRISVLLCMQQGSGLPFTKR